MICHRIDDVCIRRMAIGNIWADALTVLVHGISAGPGHARTAARRAAELVSSEDWKKMNVSLGAKRSQEQDRSIIQVNLASRSEPRKRNPRLLQSFDDRGTGRMAANVR